MHIQIKVSHATQEPKQKRRKRGNDDADLQQPAEVSEGTVSEVQQRVSPDDLTVGNVIACYLPKYEEKEPQLEIVREVTNKKVVVAWMTGDYEESWSIMKQRNGKDWTEKIAHKCILCIIKLTEENRLSDADITLNMCCP